MNEINIYIYDVHMRVGKIEYFRINNEKKIYK